MRFEKKKLAKMIDELSSYCLNKGATSLTINLESKEDRHLIELEARGVHIPDKEFLNMKSNISSHREVEMEEYCWALAGDSLTQDELCLVASMTDQAEASLTEDRLSIRLVRMIK